MVRSLYLSLRKIGYIGTIIIMTVPGSLILAFILLNYVGVKTYEMPGRVVEERQSWSVRHGYQCYIDIDTKLGRLSQLYSATCPHFWRPGDIVPTKIGVGRITGGLIGGVPVTSGRR